MVNLELRYMVSTVTFLFVDFITLLCFDVFSRVLHVIETKIILLYNGSLVLLKLIPELNFGGKVKS